MRKYVLDVYWKHFHGEPTCTIIGTGNTLEEAIDSVRKPGYTYTLTAVKVG